MAVWNANPDPNRKVSSQLRSHYHQTGRHVYCKPELCSYKRAGIELEEKAKRKNMVSVPDNASDATQWLDKVKNLPTDADLTIDRAYQDHVKVAAETLKDSVVTSKRHIDEMIVCLDHIQGLLHELQAAEASLDKLRDTDEPTAEEIKAIERREKAGQAWNTALDKYDLMPFWWSTHRRVYVNTQAEGLKSGR